MIRLILILLLWLPNALAADFPLASRLREVSERFLGKPYVLDGFGEGPTGRYDADPLHRFDAFDCTTFVETMMALALSPDRDFEKFFQTLQQIRYLNGHIDFTTRNHFPEIDWIPNNERAGFVREITAEVAGPFGVQVAEALIEKRSWYEHMRESRINVPGLTGAERSRRLVELKAEGRAFGSELSRMPYIGLDQLFPNGQPNEELFERIPAGTVLNVVRPNWDMTATEGTHLNISHQGLLVRKNGVLYMRHATSGAHYKVLDQPLRAFLRQYLGHATIKGIHLLEVRFPR